MFDAIAARYDLINRVLSGGLDQRWRVRAVKSLALQPTDTGPGLTYGTADVALAAAPRAGRVIGVDFSHEMLRLGLEKVRARALGDRIALARGDAMRLPLGAASADAAVISFGIRNVQDPWWPCGSWPGCCDRAAGWRSSNSGCRPGGRFERSIFGTQTGSYRRSGV